VSVEAISWALNLAPVPPDRGGQPSSGQYLAGGRVIVTDDPRLSFRVMLHELRSPHGSMT